jgi:hypothetical protein
MTSGYLPGIAGAGDLVAELAGETYLYDPFPLRSPRRRRASRRWTPS